MSGNFFNDIMVLPFKLNEQYIAEKERYLLLIVFPRNVTFFYNDISVSLFEFIIYNTIFI